MGTADAQPQPAGAVAWVVRWAALLPAGARVLDLACGSGRHVRWLAGTRPAGHRGRPRCRRRRAAARACRASRSSSPISKPRPGRWTAARFAAVVVTNYLWRPLWPQLARQPAAGRPADLRNLQCRPSQRRQTVEPGLPARARRIAGPLRRTAGARLRGRLPRRARPLRAAHRRCFERRWWRRAVGGVGAAAPLSVVIGRPQRLRLPARLKSADSPRISA